MPSRKAACPHWRMQRSSKIDRGWASIVPDFLTKRLDSTFSWPYWFVNIVCFYYQVSVLLRLPFHQSKMGCKIVRPKANSHLWQVLHNHLYYRLRLPLYSSSLLGHKRRVSTSYNTAVESHLFIKLNQSPSHSNWPKQLPPIKHSPLRRSLQPIYTLY